MDKVDETTDFEQAAEHLGMSWKKKRIEISRDFRRSENKGHELCIQMKDHYQRLSEAEYRIEETGLREKLLKILDGGLWHATSEDGYESIVKSGAILPNPPDVPNRERWSTSLGEDYYPYVRKLKGVSLFAFKNFDPDEYFKKWKRADWKEFVPYRKIWGSAVWIKIDRGLAQGDCISPDGLVKRQDQDNALKNKIIPGLEAAYIGKIPVCSFKQVLLVNEDGKKDICKPQF